MFFGNKKRLAEALANLLGCKRRDICLDVDSKGVVTFRALVGKNFEGTSLDDLNAVIVFVNKKWKAGDELTFSHGILSCDKGTGKAMSPAEEEDEETVEAEEEQAPFDGGTASQVDFSEGEASSAVIRDYNDNGYNVGSFSYPSKSVRRIEVNWSIGNIELIESDGDTLYGHEADANLSPEARAHVFLGDDGVLRVEAGAPNSRLFFRSWELKNFRLEIPSNVDVSVSNDCSDIIAESLNDGEVDLSCSSGNIQVDSIQADSLTVSTASGDVNIDGATVGTAELSSSSGDMDFSCDSGSSVEASTASGDVSLTLGPIGEVMVSTSSGDVTVNLGKKGATLDFSTASGDLYINSDYENDDGKIIIGDGKTSLQVSTASGDCTIN